MAQIYLHKKYCRTKSIELLEVIYLTKNNYSVLLIVIVKSLKNLIMELIINLGIITAVFLSGVRIIQDNQRAVIYRFGRFNTVKGPGIYWLFPFFERQKQVDIRTKTIELRQQTVLTKDSISIKVKTVLWYKIIDPKNAVTKVFDYNMAVYQYARTAVRNTMSSFVLDDLINNRANINEILRVNIQIAADAWGVQIELLEIKEVEIPEELQKALALDSKIRRDNSEREHWRESESKSNKTNHLLKELERLPAGPKSKRLVLTSDHWY